MGGKTALTHSGKWSAVADTAEPWPAAGSQPLGPATIDLIPWYIQDRYGWAYVDRGNASLLDREFIVAAILLGNNRRLRQALLSEISQGQSVLQAAHVYGRLIPDLARKVGPQGRLDVIDIVPLQAALCRRKLQGMTQARVRIADAADPGSGTYDVASCYFLLHEVPDEKKSAIVSALLDRVAPGGRAVFIDYHRPARFHPLRGFYRGLFERLEPYAQSMWNHEIREYAANAAAFAWEKQTLFGGVFQKVVAVRNHANRESAAD